MECNPPDTLYKKGAKLDNCEGVLYMLVNREDHYMNDNVQEKTSRML